MNTYRKKNYFKKIISYETHWFRRMRKIIAFILMLFFLSHCKKEDNTASILSFQVYVFQGVNNATVIWEPVKGYSDSVVEFSAFISDSLISSHLKTRTISVTKLSEYTTYKGRIDAFSGNRKIAEQTFEFTTKHNLPPREFSINEIAIKNNSVTLKWDESTDPEKSPVVYDIYLNEQLKVSGINGLESEVQGLIPETYYTGSIIARDSSGNTQKTTFTFGTLRVNYSMLVHGFIEYQGYKRDFAYYLPAAYDSSISIPLVINLHGANGNAWNEIGSTCFKTIADRENFILLMPQALLGSFNGETFYQWNAHYIFPWDDVSLLNYLIDYMYTKYNIDLRKVYISGMSNGGFMTYFAARSLQERVAAIAPISGLISSNVFENYTLNRPLPLCYMHGTADNIVRIDGTPSADDIIGFWVANNKCTSTPVITQLPDIAPYDNSTVTLYQYTGYSTDSDIQFYKVNGGGHSIPGIEPGANMDINAYEVIWSFFKRHSYPGHTEGKIVRMK
jgi:poly(3-hydroxybutyrate) depolymerase